MVDLRTLFIGSTSSEPQNDLIIEQKRDRLVLIICAGAVPFVVLAVFHHTLTTVMVLQAYLLTSIEFGLVFFVKESENIRRSWLWKAVAFCILFHVTVLLPLFYWEGSAPQLADKGLVVTGVLFVPAFIELYVFLWIVELCKPSGENR
jgi:hypothetical protein